MLPEPLLFDGTDVSRRRKDAPYSDGRQYATFIVDEGIAGVRAAYGAGLARLVALKDRFDPANVFRLNANIPPSVK